MPILLSHFIDACRWIGALLVLAVHANNLFLNLADIMTAPHGAAVYGWWFFVSFGLGHQAVVGFFAISGYLVGGAVLAMLRERRAGLADYFVHRVTRIYIVLVPAMILTAALDWVGRSYFGAGGAYDRPELSHDGIVEFLGTMASLQKIWFELYGSNGAMWSLSCEFWYYITFPLLLLPFATAYAPATRAVGFALGVALLVFLATPPSWFLFGYLLWALGALATLAPRPLMRSRWLALGLLVVALIPIRLLVRGPNLVAYPFLQDAADLLSGVLFLNLVVTIRFSDPKGWRLLHTPEHSRLANFSFSLYCVHTPILVLGQGIADRAFGVGWSGALATPLHWWIMALAMIVSVAVAYLFSLVTEARTGAVRRALRAALARLMENRRGRAPAEAERARAASVDCAERAPNAPVNAP
jgi:peptidoglycan/LPS O-acetylase OafA/YrhL